MTRELSIYLDAVRLTAALVVFLSHYGWRSFGGGLLWQFSFYAAPPVVVFFVLSGFVIGYASGRRETTARDYAIARAARIYSVALPAVVLTACLDWLGARADPAIYAPYPPLLGAGAWHLPVCLAFLNEAWGAHIFLGSDGPYWSLGYEVLYYAMFGLAYYGSGAGRIWGILAIAGIAGPQVLAALPLWVAGWALYRAKAWRRIGPAAGWAVFLGSILAAIAFDRWARRSGILATPYFAILVQDKPFEFVQDYAVGALFCLNLIGFNAIAASFRPLLRLVERPVRWLAGATFSLYLLHYPLMLFVCAMLPWPHQAWRFRVVLLVVPLAAVYGAAELSERRKQVWRRGFARLLAPRGLAASGAAAGPRD